MVAARVGVQVIRKHRKDIIDFRTNERVRIIYPLGQERNEMLGILKDWCYIPIKKARLLNCTKLVGTAAVSGQHFEGTNVPCF